jgi:hypothetical protein
MKRLLVLCLAFLPTLAFGQGAGEKLPTPPDLALVPNDALAVAHVKVSEIWKDEAMKDIRSILEKAGAKALKAFNERYSPMPSTVERVTAYALIPQLKGPDQTPKIVCIIALAAPIDRTAFLKQFAPKVNEKKGKFGTYFEDDDEFMAVRFVSDKMFAFGTADALAHMVNTPLPTKEGPLTPAIELASGNRPIVLGVNTNFMPQDDLDRLLQGLPEAVHPLFKARSITASIDFEKEGHLHAEVRYSDKQLADDAEKALDAATKLAKEQLDNLRAQLEERLFGDTKPANWNDFAESAAMLVGLGGLKHAQDILDAKPFKRRGETFALTVPLPPYFKTLAGSGAIAAAAMTPSLSKIQEAAYVGQTQNNLKQIGLAMHNYHDTFNGLPAAAICDKKGKPLLSWRVAILPYVEQDNLYKQFKLDEPWDSDHNKKLLEKMPKVYEIPAKVKHKPGMTHYRVFVGNGAMFDKIQMTGFAAVTDGLSNTWMVVESEEGVEWTKPEDFDFDPAKDVPKLGKFFRGGFNVLLGDGSVRHFKTVPPQVKDRIQRNDGNVIAD